MLGPGEQWVISRSTVGEDRLTVELHRPNTLDSGRTLAWAEAAEVKDREPKMLVRQLIEECRRQANRSNG